MQFPTSEAELMRVKIELLQRLGESLSGFSDPKVKKVHTPIAKQVESLKITNFS